MPLREHSNTTYYFLGVDETVVVVMKFSRKRMALCAFSIAAPFPNDAVISGTKGSIKVCFTYTVLSLITFMHMQGPIKGNVLEKVTLKY